MDPGLFEPVIDPDDRQGGDVHRAGSIPNYMPAPGSTPFPACWSDEFTKTPAPSGLRRVRPASPGRLRGPVRLAGRIASPERRPPVAR